MRGTLISPKEFKELHSLFVQFDADGNGELDVEELKKMTETLKIIATTEDLKIMMAQLDEDGSGTIDCNELLELIDGVLAESYTGDEIEESFKVISDSEDLEQGLINSKKLSSAITLAGVYIPEDEVMDLVDEVDDSGDGVIDFNEFRNTVLGF